jgi:predicted nucleic acid-binding protein
MTTRWVLNASPVICLARAGYLRLLHELPEEAILPGAVAAEIEAGPKEDPARQALITGEFRIVDTSVRAEVLAWDLGQGETAVLSFALSNSGWEAILDDLAARKCARSFSIFHRGTLAVVILAKKQGLITSASEVMRALQAAGLRLEDQVIREALQQTVGEDW